MLQAVENSVNESNPLEAQLNQYREVNKGLIAQCDAVKQMHNDALTTILQLRTSLNLMQNQLNEWKNIVDEKEKVIADLNSKVKELSVKSEVESA